MVVTIGASLPGCVSRTLGGRRPDDDPGELVRERSVASPGEGFELATGVLPESARRGQDSRLHD